MAECIASYMNSEGEKATIEKVVGGEFDGQVLLVIHDDWPSIHMAPMLLDQGTVEWLLAALPSVHSGGEAR